MAEISFISQCEAGNHLTFDVTMDNGNVYRETFEINDFFEPLTFQEAKTVLMTNAKMRVALSGAQTVQEVISTLDGLVLKEAFEVQD